MLLNKTKSKDEKFTRGPYLISLIWRSDRVWIKIWIILMVRCLQLHFKRISISFCSFSFFSQ